MNPARQIVKLGGNLHGRLHDLPFEVRGPGVGIRLAPEVGSGRRRPARDITQRVVRSDGVSIRGGQRAQVRTVKGLDKFELHRRLTQER